MNFQEFVSKHEVTMSVAKADSNPHMDDGSKWEANHFLCTLKVGSKTMEVPFSKGVGLEGKPTAVEVLECLASDARGVQYADSFEEWAGDLGYDTDSRRAERTFNTCVDQMRKLVFLLGGEAFHELIEEVEEE